MKRCRYSLVNKIFISLQGIFGMIIFCCIVIAISMMLVLYILVLRTIIVRHRLVQPLNSDNTGPQATTNTKNTQHNAVHSSNKLQKVKSRGSKRALKLLRCDFGPTAEEIVRQENGNDFDVKAKRKPGMIKRKSNKIHAIPLAIETKIPPTKQDQLESTSGRAHNKSSTRGSMTVSGRNNNESNHAHMTVVNATKTRTDTETDSLPLDNDFVKADQMLQKNKTVSQSSPVEINPSLLSDLHLKSGGRNNSIVSNISSSEVEMTWRSQRVLRERNNQQVRTCSHHGIKGSQQPSTGKDLFTAGC